MPFAMLMIRVPDSDTTPEEARPYLIDFLDWLWDFFKEIEQEREKSLSNLFVANSIGFLPPSLAELSEGAFSRVREGVDSLGAEFIIDHGLFGAQLRWKLTNVNNWYERFTNELGARALMRLLQAINSFLKSLIGTVPGGQGIVELKEAIENSIDEKTTEP